MIDPAPTRTPIPTPDPRPDGAGGGAGVKNLISVGVGRGRNWKKIRKSGWGGAGTGKKIENRSGGFRMSITTTYSFIANTRCLSTNPTKIEAFYAHLGLNLLAFQAIYTKIG